MGMGSYLGEMDVYWKGAFIGCFTVSKILLVICFPKNEMLTWFFLLECSSTNVRAILWYQCNSVTFQSSICNTLRDISMIFFSSEFFSTDWQKVMHNSPPYNLHRWAQYKTDSSSLTVLCIKSILLFTTDLCRFLVGPRFESWTPL